MLMASQKAGVKNYFNEDGPPTVLEQIEQS